MVLMILFFAFNCLISAYGSCQLGWVQQDQSCYHFSRESETWASAQHMCGIHNARLANIETATENEFLKTRLLSDRHNGDVWIGGSDLVSEGSWVWEPLGQPIVFSDWAHHQPDNAHGGEQCLLMSRGDDYKWRDTRCASLQHYVCEMGAIEDQ